MTWADEDCNPYYSPQNLGLTIVGMLEDPDAFYSYDTLVVWQHEDGGLVWAQDSGCSCPIPFENAELHPLTNETWDEFAAEVATHCPPSRYHVRTGHEASKTELLSKVSALLSDRHITRGDQ